MQNLIHALLNYSRTNTVDSQVEVCDLNVIVSEVLFNLSELIEEHHVDVKLSTLPVLDIVPHQFQQLFLNLITNSIKYRSPARPLEIMITAEREKAADGRINFRFDDCWHITVKDNGIGFDQKYAEQIFVLFQRLHGREKYEGTGIGLALCKKIVENHGGIIVAVGEPKLGAAFHIYLPTRNDHAGKNNLIN